MIRRTAGHVAAVVYAAVDVGVILAPAVVLAATAQKGGLPDSHGIDLLLASAVIGLVHGVVAWSRLRGETHVAARAVDVWISAIDALVVLALGSTLLLLAVLGGLADSHAVLVNSGWPVVALWVGVQLVAVTLSEVTGRVLFRWLEPVRNASRRVEDDVRQAPAGVPVMAGTSGDDRRSGQ